MGWASGSSLMSEIIKAAKMYMENDLRRRDFYVMVINAMENADWDTQNECEGEDDAFDEALSIVYPGLELL